MTRNAIAKNVRPESHTIKSHFFALVLAALCTALCACGTAKVSSRHEIGPLSTGKPAVIYVSDFELDASDITSEPGILPALPKAPGPLGRILPTPPGAPKDPRVLARELVASMNASLVEELIEAGLGARRLLPGEPAPTSGWLVRGLFTEVNQGNQLRRAVIGFGAGKTDLQVLVDISDLAQGAPRPFYELSTAADSGRAPGAGPAILLGPAGVAARYVIAGSDLERSVRQTAAKIAAEVVQRVEQTKTR